MSAKKNKTKKHHRHEKNDGHSLQMSKDRNLIKKMVGAIPALIMKEGYFDKSTANQQPQTEQSMTKNRIVIDEETEDNYIDNSNSNEPRYTTPMVIIHPKKRLWLWTGVIIVTIAIFGIWILNLKNIFYDIRNDRGFEESIIDNSKKDFNDIWKTIKAEDEKIQKQVNNNDAEVTASTTQKNLESILNEIITPLKNTNSTTTI